MTDPVERVARHLDLVEGGRDEKTVEAVFDWIECQGIPIDKLLSGKTAPVSMEFLQAYDHLVEEWQNWTGKAATAEERKTFERKLLKAARQPCPGPEQYLAQPETAWPTFDSSKSMTERQQAKLDAAGGQVVTPEK